MIATRQATSLSCFLAFYVIRRLRKGGKLNMDKNNNSLSLCFSKEMVLKWKQENHIKRKNIDKLARKDTMPFRKTWHETPIRQSVYAMLTSDGLVKIGRTDDICKRVNEVEKYYKVKIVDVFYSVPTSKANHIEKEAHDIFADYWEHHEFFLADIDEVLSVIANLDYWYVLERECYTNTNDDWKNTPYNIISTEISLELAEKYHELAHNKRSEYFRKRSHENDYFMEQFKYEYYCILREMFTHEEKTKFRKMTKEEKKQLYKKKAEEFENKRNMQAD